MLAANEGARTQKAMTTHTHRLALRAIVIVILAAALHGPTSAEISLTPVWQSPSSGVPTGAGWADFDGNGWLDLVVTNGLDFKFAANTVYFNTEGEIATTPGWTSTDTLSSGNLFIGDLDGDGDPDLVNANMGHIPSGRGAQPHTIYLNEGGLHHTPDWFSPPGNAFSCAGGDPDGDGDIDIAFGQGLSAIDPKNAKRQKAVIYFNENGTFPSEPGWESDSLYIAVDIAFADIDRDGDHDLALTGRGMGLAIFYNHDGQLETTPSWHKTDFVGGRQMAFADIDDDGYPELALCKIDAYGAEAGEFWLFDNPDGFLDETPAWSCSTYVEPCAVAWADVDADGDLDLAGAGWYSHVGVFENIGGRLTNEYVWSHTPGWAEQIAWGDFNEDGVYLHVNDFRTAVPRTLFYLGHKAIHAITEVQVDDVTLNAGEYCYDLVEGWISLANPLRAGSKLRIVCELSTKLDLAVTTTRRTRVYENRPQTIPENANILILLDDGFGANYNFESGRFANNIRNHFERYGWNVTVTGLAAQLDSCSVSGADFGSKSVTIDIPLTEITDLSPYDCLTIMPGRDHTRILSSPEALALVKSAVEEGLVVSAWCRAVRVLAAADAIRGKEITGHSDYQSDYEAAGATYIGDDVLPVTDGNIVTSVRSRFYRTETCEAIAHAIAAKKDGR